jgi:hypothetical protein
MDELQQSVLEECADLGGPFALLAFLSEKKWGGLALFGLIPKEHIVP